MNTNTKIDVNAPGIAGLLYGVPTKLSESEVVFLPVDFAGTTSFGGGAERGYQILLNASDQVEITSKFSIFGIYPDAQIGKLHKVCRAQFKKIHDHFSGVKKISPIELQNLSKKVDGHCAEVDGWLMRNVYKYLKKGKMVVTIGGDHGSIKGAIMAHAEMMKGKNENLSLLHFDAHYDLRKALDGCEGSHGSAMRYVLDRYPNIDNFVSVGVRSFCEEETDYIVSQNNNGKTRIYNYNYESIYSAKMNNASWIQICSNIVNRITNHDVYITIDIDGLKAYLCPGTGTPQWGGLEMEEVLFLIEKISKEKNIVGIDINEVSEGHSNHVINGIVAAELAYKVAGYMYDSQKKFAE